MRRLVARVASGLLLTWIRVPIAVGVGLMLTALVDQVSDVSGIRNGLFLLGAFLALSGLALVAAYVCATVLRRHGPLAQSLQNAQAAKLASSGSGRKT
jgi:hypothetical protein